MTFSTYLSELRCSPGEMQKTVVFFLSFARFEYALKASGYFSDDRSVKANWDRFASDLQTKCSSQDIDNIMQAGRYLLNEPPAKQVVTNSELGWQKVPIRERSLPELYAGVRRVRNNLFHGGKLDVTIQEPSRDYALITACIAILSTTLNLKHAETIRRFYDADFA